MSLASGCLLYLCVISNFWLCNALQSVHTSRRMGKPLMIPDHYKLFATKARDLSMVDIMEVKADEAPTTSANGANDSSSLGSTKHSIFLFSLPAWNLLETSTTTGTNNNSLGAHAALLVRRLWEWKDDVLGDGRDFFVPRPKTLGALNQILKQQIPHATECVVLSNCARFDVLVVVGKMDHGSSTEDGMLQRVQQPVAQALIQQYTHYKKETQKQKSNKFSLAALFEGPGGGGDQPDRLLLDPPCLRDSAHDSPATTITTADDDDCFLEIKTLTNNLQALQGPESIARYLCRVATGLQAQGRRPGRDVVFRPFSSRDAHVMLQLKRTADVASSNSRIKSLLDTALQAGKAARDPAKVPAILPLKKYGSGGSNSRYSLGDAPSELTEAAAKQAEELSIEPSVDKYVDKWAVLEVSEQIQAFRSAVQLATDEYLGVDLETSPEAKPIRAMMHPHVMNIRSGRPPDLDEILREIQALQ
ncbi:expressed unknown protein [Seminavis robusta]|uniref:Uncharacterized protein n=1 Tax=Seminavis robusta TaxID=568900 RepID=A0A9N8DRT8_9STRA|nr:expressed unknown protein [Seminavis robusta]|eukprot:Sro208_g087020.1 n/a (475) ;mRNA; r:23675-25099